MTNGPFLLRQRREAAGLHIAALAAALKVPVKKLEALEAGRYDQLPDMTFARALASSACRHLKTDPAPVLEQIPHAIQPELGDSKQAINAPFKASASVAPANPAGWLSRPAVLGALVLVLAALVLVFLPDRISDPAPPAPVSLEPVPGAMPEPSVAPDSPPAGQPGLPGTSSLSTPDAAAAGAAGAAGGAADPSPGPVDQVPAPAPASSETPANLPAASSSLLTITATAEAWVEVVNGAGSLVMQRVLKPGDVVDFSAAPPYAVVLGRADGVEVAVRGRPFDVMPYARNNVARFEVK